MAKGDNSILLRQVRGQIGKQIVVKHYGKKIVITSYPDMSRIKPSKQQQANRKLFAEAVSFARDIQNDPEKNALYKRRVKKGQTVYNCAISEYLRKINS